MFNEHKRDVMSINNRATIKEFIRKLYPTLLVHELTAEFNIKSYPASGISNAKHLCFEQIPEQLSMVLTKKIPPKFLGCLNRVCGFITLDEDPSSHTSIVCRSQGVPIVNVTEKIFKQLVAISKIWDKAIAIDTFRRKIMIGKFTLKDDHVLLFRKKILNFIKCNTKLRINANSDTDLELKRAINLGFEHSWPRSETFLYDPCIFPWFIAFLLMPHHQLVKTKFIEETTNEIKKMFNMAKKTRLTFRLLDPPSHEFFPALNDTVELSKISDILKVSKEEIRNHIKKHMETNPMIGNRGVRLLLSNQTLLNAQITGLFNGWIAADPKLRPPLVEILVPFVMIPSEFKYVKNYIVSLKKSTAEWIDIPVRYGCMVEVPSILDFPEELAVEVDFFSFGTNDLISLMYGISRGDAYHRYFSKYLNEKIMDINPFIVIPDKIVSKIQEFCVKAKKINPNLITDICGEQALNTDLSLLLNSGAIDAVSIGIESLPILAGSLIKSGLISLSSIFNCVVGNEMTI